MLVLAANIYVENESEGTIALDRKNLKKDFNGYKGFKSDSNFCYKLKYLKRMPYAPKTYFYGTTPENGYKLPKGPWKFILSTNKYSKLSNGIIKFFIRTSGADNPRPFRVRKNNKGIWKIVGNASSFFTGMKKPVETVSDDL